jgi:glucokinase
MIYIAVSTGIGGGIIINNSLLRGSSGFSNEIGHLMVDPDGPECTCGIHGHLEALSSGPAMVRWVKAQLSDEKINNFFHDDKLDPKSFEEAALSGNQLAAAAYERSGRYLGIAIADLIHIFNPEIVIIGGGISNAGELLLEPIRESVASHLISSAYLDNLIITQAKLGDKSGLLGALTLAREISSL